MTIQEIIEAHLRVKGVRGLETLCICGWHTAQRLRPEDLHRAHLAEVLDEAMRGKQAIAWAHGFHKGRKTDNGSHISTWPKNPYREEATNGR